MAYIAQSDLVPRRLTQQELVELTDDGKTGEVDAAVVAAVLDEASAKLDAYSRGRHALPLVASEQVKGIALDVAVFLLFLRRRRVSAEIEAGYDRALSFLRDIAAGKASFDQPGKAQVAGQAVKIRDHAADPETFDKTKTEAF